MFNFAILVLGAICAGLGGELFVRGTVGLARWARVSTAIIGATVAAFATSSPELAVGIGSAVAGTPGISFGDVLGSNVVNIALILALALALSGTKPARGGGPRDFVVALLAPAIAGLMLLDGMISRFDGLLMLAAFVVWLAVTIREARRQRTTTGVPVKPGFRHSGILPAVVGLALLLLSGRLVVTGAKGIALALGIDGFIIGATIVALGTSMPELATILVARRRGHDEIGLGMMLGSNIFNGLFVVGIVAVISPIPVNGTEALPALLCGLASVLLILPGCNRRLGRLRALPLFALYAVYLVATYLARAMPD